MCRLNIGRLCAGCICAKCGYLKDCGIMEGNTNWYCHNICMGEAGAMNRCSQFEPITPASETEPWEEEK